MADNFLKVFGGIELASSAIDPNNPVNGDMYYNTTYNSVRIYQNSAWADFGVQGVTGLVGTTGLLGQTGLIGITGLVGQTGIQGITGLVGQTGLIGITGLQGQTGLIGITGLIGQTGFQGQTGLVGLTGLVGQTGIQGQTGIAAIIGGTSGDVVTIGAGGVLTDSSIAASNLFKADGSVNATGAFNLNTHQINNVSNPASAQDAVTLTYLQNNLPSKFSVKYATTVALPPLTYANGTLGVGATLTNNSTGPWITAYSDSGTIPVLTDRILVKNQQAIYTFTVSTASATAGATYTTNNGQTFTVTITLVSGTTLVCSGTGVPPATGTLTKTSGTGTSFINFSAVSTSGTTQNGIYTFTNLGNNASAAFFSGTITGTSTSITLHAVNPGTIGNSINLTFTGSNTINQEITTWNSANPSNHVSLFSGNGNQTPSNGAHAQLAGGVNAASWVLTRSTDFNNSIAGQVSGGDYIYVSAAGNGITNTNTAWNLVTDAAVGTNAVVFGTNNLVFQPVVTSSVLAGFSNTALSNLASPVINTPLSLGSNQINNVADPTSAQDALTLNYFTNNTPTNSTTLNGFLNDLTYSVGTDPQGIAFDGTYMWICNQGSGTVSKLLASNGATIGTYSVGSDPQAVVFDGTNIWIVNEGSNNVTVLNAYLGTQTSFSPVSVGSGPDAAVFDGTNMWVINYGADTATIVNASTGTPTGFSPVSVGSGPSSAVFDGTNIWIANSGSSNVTVVNASTGIPTGFSPVSVGSDPVSIAFDGTNIWIANFGSNSITVVNASTGIPTGFSPISGLSGPVSVAFDGVNIWVINQGANTVYKLLISNGSTIGTFTVGSVSVALAFDGVDMWVVSASSNSVSKISIQSQLSTGSGANTQLSNLTGTTAVPVDLLPATTNTENLGAPALLWDVLYVSYLNDTSSNHSIIPNDRTLYDPSGNVVLNWATPLNVLPGTDININFGSPSLRWDNFYAAAVNTDQIALGSNGSPLSLNFTSGTTITPSTDNTIILGSTANRFADISTNELQVASIIANGGSTQVVDTTTNYGWTFHVAPDVGTHQIHNLADPTSAQDALTLNYFTNNISPSTTLNGYLNDLTYAVGNQSAAVVGGVIFDGMHIWVANSPDNTVTKLLASNGATIGTYSVGLNPVALVFDGTYIWVGNSGDGTVTKLRASNGASIGVYTVGGNPQGLTFDGTNVWITDEDTGNVYVLNASTGTPTSFSPVTVGAGGYVSLPRDIVFDGANIWVANYSDNTVNALIASTGVSNIFGPSIIFTVTAANATAGDTYTNNSQTFTVSTTIVGGTTLTTTGTGTPTGSGTLTLLVGSGDATITFSTFLSPISVGTGPWGMAFDGTNIWIANQSSNNVTELLASTGALVGTFTVGGTPQGVVFDGMNICVASYGNSTLTQLLASNGTTSRTFSAGTNPIGVAFDGVNFWVANPAGNSVSKISIQSQSPIRTWNKEVFTLASGDITNQYITLAYAAILDSQLVYGRAGVTPSIGDEGYEVASSIVSGVTRISFTNAWATGGGSALVSGNVLIVQYQY